MFSIAQRFGVSLDALIAANPHITDPNLIFPGDVLCVPGPPPELVLPCCARMGRTGLAPVDAAGVVLVRQMQQLRPGRTAVTVSAHGLPHPSDFGGFDAYEAVTFIPNIIAWVFRLFSTPEVLPTWSGTFTEITETLTPDTMAHVRPVNTQTGVSGPVLLATNLASCRQ